MALNRRLIFFHGNRNQMLVNNHWRFVCGILGIVVLGAAMVWLSRHDADAEKQRLEHLGEQIGTVLAPDETPNQAH